MNSYEVTLINKALLRESVEKGTADTVDKYCKTITVDVPAYLIGVGVIDFLDGHLRYQNLIKEGWEMSDYRKIK